MMPTIGSLLTPHVSETPESQKATEGQTAPGTEAVKAAKDFESFFVGTVFQGVFESVPKSEFMGGGPGGDLYQSLFIQEIVSKAVSGSGLGLSEQISRLYSQPTEKVGDFTKII